MNDYIMQLWDRMQRQARRLAARGTWRDADRMRQRWYAWQARTLAARYGLVGNEADDREVVIAG